MTTRAVRALGAALAGLLLAGCVPSLPFGGPSQAEMLAKVRSIDGGECFRAGDGGGPVLDFSREVPCAQEHELEVLHAVLMSPEWAEMDAAQAVELAGPGGELFDHVMPSCFDSFVEWTGVAETIGAVPGLDGNIGLWPGINGYVRLYLAPDGVWQDYPAAFCVFERPDGEGGVLSGTSATDEPLVSTYGRADTPEDLGVCLVIDQNLTTVACDRPHHAEVLFEFDAELALGAEWVAAVDPAAPSQEAWADMDEICRRAETAVFGAERTTDDVVIGAEVLAGTWAATTGMAEAEFANAYPVICLAIVTDASVMLDGTVWGLGDGPAPFVPAGPA